MSVLALAGALSLAIGAVLGLLGGGGGILAVPVLVYALGVPARPAIATSLFFVAATSLAGALAHARAGRVRWRIAALFGAASMTGAFVGARVGRWLPERALLAGLSALMLVTALAMLRSKDERREVAVAVAPARVLAIGGAVGLLSGLVGAGGGFLIVPALTLFGGLALREAIATSLLIIAMQSFAGFVGHLGHVALDGTLIAVMTAAAIVGMLVGTSLGRRVSPGALKRAFAGLVAITGLFMLARQTSLAWAGLAAVLTVAFGVVQSLRSISPRPRGEDPVCVNSPRLQR
jgi:uncharacterized membrane protein YfcA